ncbi:MAG TPA: hydrogenase, partial [Vicinamibacteria bacterium]|nr:hydrogenase [Vicinamibacteria bacterium]
MSATAENAFFPHLAELTEVRDLATGIKLFRCRPLESQVRFRYVPGQFGFLSAIGVGEAPFGMAVSEQRGRGQV